MKVIIGLGNPGQAYENSRHNLGWMVVELLIERWHAAAARFQHYAALANADIDGNHVVFMKPLTSMNRSGKAVQSLARTKGIPETELLVVHDEMDLPLGKLRLRPRGGGGGHKGLESVLGALGTEAVPRLRIGIGSPPARIDPISHVLGDFSNGEMPQVEQAVKLAADTVECFVREGISTAMDRHNRPPGFSPPEIALPLLRSEPTETSA